MMEDEDFQPKILAFLCNWCSYAGADLAGVSRYQYPPFTKVIRVPCSGRVDPLFIIKALNQGIDGVWISGCHIGDCHYQTGNYYARRRFALIKNLLGYVGVEEDRVLFSWISASEGVKFAETSKEVSEKVKKLGKIDKFVRKGR